MSATLATKTFGHSFHVDWKNRVRALILSRNWARKLGKTPITANCLDATLWNNGVLRLVIKGIGMRPKFIPSSLVFASLEEIAEGQVDYAQEDVVQAVEAECLEAAEWEQAREETANEALALSAEAQGEFRVLCLLYDFWEDFEGSGAVSFGLEIASAEYANQIAYEGAPYWPFVEWIEMGERLERYLSYDERDAKAYQKFTGRPQIASAEAMHPDNEISDYEWSQRFFSLTYQDFFVDSLKVKRSQGNEKWLCQAFAERAAFLMCKTSPDIDEDIDYLAMAHEVDDWVYENKAFFKGIKSLEEQPFPFTSKKKSKRSAAKRGKGFS